MQKGTSRSPSKAILAFHLIFFFFLLHSKQSSNATRKKRERERERRGKTEKDFTASSLVSLHWVGVVNKYAGLSLDSVLRAEVSSPSDEKKGKASHKGSS